MSDRRTVDSLLRRLGHTDIPTPPTGDLSAWLPDARATAKRLRRDVQRELGVTEAVLEAGSGADEPWRAVEQATQRVEQELLKNGTLRTRLDQGRRSLMPKVEARLEAAAKPVVHARGGRLVGELAEEGVEALKAESASWTEAWVAYVYGQVDADLQDLIRVAWSPRAGDLPVPAPTLGALEIRQPGTRLEIPEVQIVRDKVGWGAGFRHARSVLYAVLSMGLILGIRTQLSTVAVMIPVGIAALAFGIVQARGEGASAEERLGDEVRRRADSALAGALRSWLDRQADKIVADAGQQLLQRRQRLVTWYREQVVPARTRWERQQADRKAQLEEARRKRPTLQARLRDLKQLESALKALDAS